MTTEGKTIKDINSSILPVHREHWLSKKMVKNEGRKRQGFSTMVFSLLNMLSFDFFCLLTECLCVLFSELSWPCSCWQVTLLLRDLCLFWFLDLPKQGWDNKVNQSVHAATATRGTCETHLTPSLVKSISNGQKMTTPALLPLSGRRIPTLSPGASSFPHHRATLRLSEKFILLLILSAFITLCFGAFFFLPDNSKHKRFDLGLEDVLIPHIDTPKEGKHASGQVIIHGQGGHDEHRHR